jgi:hypothetical protein
MKATERQWMLRFIELLTKALAAGFGLEPKQFIEQGRLPAAVRDDMLRRGFEFQTIPALTRLPAENTAPRALGSCLWFPGKQDARQRELFFGYGAMTIWYVAADEHAEAPPLPFGPGMRSAPMLARVFNAFDVEQMFSTLFAIQHRAFEKSARLVADLGDSAPEAKRSLIVLPVLTSSDFFTQREDVVKGWFEIFDVYLRESATDNGLLLAAKMDLSEAIVGIVESMRAEALEYPA